MEKKVAIVQSSYIPWKGYFDLINSVDEFVLYDDAQYTKRDWRNRNVIKTPRGLLWLTIPVETKGKRTQRVMDTRISDPNWNERHWRTIIHNYSGARYFTDYRSTFEGLFLDCREDLLSRVNYRFIIGVCEILGIKTHIRWSSDYPLKQGRTERLLGICAAAGASEYYSGPSAKTYLQKAQFEQAGIQVTFADYSDYPPYQQLHGEFVHEVSVIDLVLNQGPFATEFMKSFRDEKGSTELEVRA